MEAVLPEVLAHQDDRRNKQAIDLQRRANPAVAATIPSALMIMIIYM